MMAWEPVQVGAALNVENLIWINARRRADTSTAPPAASKALMTSQLTRPLWDPNHVATCQDIFP